MKHSITKKYTVLLSGLLILTISSSLLLNKTFLAKYYQNSKCDTLVQVYTQIKDILDDLDGSIELSDDQNLELDRITSGSNVTAYVISSSILPVYPSNDRLSETVRNSMVERWFMYRPVFFDFYDNWNFNSKTIRSGKGYGVVKIKDVSLDINFLDLVSAYDNTYYIFLRTNFDSIEENVAIANKFFAYVGIITTVFGAIAMYLMSRKIARPIKKLSEVAKGMSNLDFNIKYQGKSKDEIGELGNSINVLSERLEHTISDLKCANNELQRDIEKKTQIDEMRKEFLSNVTHELKTPIALIQGYAEGLQDNINDDEESKNFYCEVIVDEANKMNTMVKKLLSLNQLEFGNNFVEFERFDLITVIRSVLASTEILMNQKNVTLHFESEKPIYVWADEYLVEEVITNYISNAINHVSGLNVIEIKLIDKGDVVRVAVYNTGERIPEEDLDKVWIKFYKVDKARTREYGGTGIGLSIVKAIMNSLHRECGVVNHDAGVEFWFELDKKMDE